MPDIQLDQLRDAGNRCDVFIMQAVTGIDDEADFGPIARSLGNTRQFRRLRSAARVCETAGMQLDDRRRHGLGSIELRRVGVDE